MSGVVGAALSGASGAVAAPFFHILANQKARNKTRRRTEPPSPRSILSIPHPLPTQASRPPPLQNYTTS